MDSQHIKIRIGLACAVFLVATVVLVMLFGGGKMPRLFSSDYEIYVLLKQAPMLNENSPISKNGVEIGRVTRVRLVDDDRMVEITARIKGNVKLYTNEDCNLSLNLLGQSTLNFMPRTDEPLGEVLAAKSTIHGVTPIDLMRVADALQSDASKALRSMTDVANEMKVVLGVINQVLGSPEEVAQKLKRLEDMAERAAQMITVGNSVLSSVNELISDQEIKEGIKVSTTQLPAVIAEGKKLMARFNEVSDQIVPLLKRMDGTIGKVDLNLDNIAQFTEALGENGPQIAESLTIAAQQFEVSLTQLSEFSRSLNNPDGSIGQLLGDPEFFQSLSSTIRNADRTIKNMERITVLMQPILQDVNVFTDKIAREPGQLGLKGLVSKNPPTKGLPNAYATPWQPVPNGGILQQSERIQLIRPRNWPLGVQQFQYRNEPVPLQNRYASQVIDLPDSPYDDADFGLPTSLFGVYDEAAMPIPEVRRPESEARSLPLSYQTPQIASRNRVVIVPMNVPSTSPEVRSTTTLEIDFTPINVLPVRLASGSVATTPPIIQPLHGKSEPAPPQNVVQPVQRSEIKIPTFQPTF